LQAASSIESGASVFLVNLSCVHPVYVRGEAYLAAGQGGAAAEEFQKILDHSGIVWNCSTGAVAHLGLARAYALESRTSHDADAARVRTTPEQSGEIFSLVQPRLALYSHLDRRVELYSNCMRSSLPRW